ncbi:MAG: hypothetical protein Q9170_002228 [Blastenia crenularia]
MNIPAYTTPGTPPRADAEMQIMKPIPIAHMQYATPGYRPASVMPRKRRAISKPLKFCTTPINVITVPHATIIEGNHIEGLSRLRRRLEGTSKAQ